MGRITFLRHAMPEVESGVGPEGWRLSGPGAAAAAALQIATSGSTRALSSPELKARQTTALALGSPLEAIVTDARFREVDREERVHDGFRDARRVWVAGRLDRRHRRWEAPKAAAQRFHEGLLAHAAEHLVVGTHGMVLTAWMVDQGLITPGDEAVAFWEALALPDVIELTLPLRRVRAVLTDADGRHVLIKRTRPGGEPYWTAPGGGVALTDISHEDALRRELREELGAEADIGPGIFERPIDGIRSEIFHRARLVSLDPSLRCGPEFDDPARGTYEIEHVAADELPLLDLRPMELKALLVSDIRSGGAGEQEKH